MTIERKLLGISPSGGATDVADVFSTDVYTGTGSGQTIYNGIDLKNEGGLVWVKNRGASANHCLFDSVRGSGGTQDKRIFSNSSAAETTGACDWAGFEQGYEGAPNGFVLNGNGSSDRINQSGQKYVSWAFRKKEKFFDIQTYDGTGSAGLSVAHDLGVIPAFMLVKAYGGSGASGTGNWFVWSNQINFGNGYAHLNLTNAWETDASNIFGNGSSFVHPTDTHFTIGGYSDINYRSGSDYKKYIAYLFASNDSEDAEDQMIKCSSFTSSSANQVINLGWEPQFVLVKSSSNNMSWYIFDTTRGIVAGGNDSILAPNDALAEETASQYLEVTPTGFISHFNTLAGSRNYIFVAIRAPMMVEPKAATDVFAVDAAGSGVAPAFESGFPVDLAIYRNVSSTVGNTLGTRMLGTGELFTNNNAAIAGSGAVKWDFSNGFYNSTSRSASYYSWMWKRAKGYFDVVAYSGNSTAKNVAHSLGVAPEMMWVKKRSGQEGWAVYHKLNGGTHFARLESNASYIANNGLWNNTDTTASVFRVGTDTEVNQSGQKYIAYLFASLAGISKVGSFSGSTGNVVNVECGFAPRLVLIKKSNGTGNWLLFDTVRGIVSGNDAKIQLDLTDPQNSATDYIDPYSTGFSLSLDTEINENGKSFIFYAIA